MSLRRPNQGVISELRPSFYPENMYGGMASTDGVAANATVALGVFNNDTKGRSIAVWHLEAHYRPGTSGVDFMTFFFQVIQGTNGWTPGPAAPVMGGRSAGFGQIINAYDLNWPTVNTYYAAYTNPLSWFWPHEWPLAIVPPGYSFFAYSDPSFTGGGANAMLISCLFESAPTPIAQ